MKPRIPLPAPFDSHPFSHFHATSVGLGKSRLDGRDLARPFHGVRHPDVGELTIEQRCRALASRLPEMAFFSSVTAAQLLRVPLPARLQVDSRVHVSIEVPGRAIRRAGVIGHAVQLMTDDVSVWNGLRVSTPERLWCELSAVLRLDDLVAAGDHLIHWRLPMTSIEQLQTAMAKYPSRSGLPLRRDAIELLDERAESPMESHTRMVLRRGILPPFESNFWVSTPGGRYRVDFAFPEHRTFVEYQGAHHFDIEQWRSDMTRRSRLEAVGWRGIDISRRDLEHGAELCARIAAVLRQQGWGG